MKAKIKIPKGFRRVPTGQIRMSSDWAWTINFDSTSEAADIKKFRPADSYDKDYRVGEPVKAKEFVIRRLPKKKPAPAVAKEK